MNCLFCESEEIKARMIAENEHAWAVPTNIPITPGHTLVLPKRHVQSLFELTQDEIRSILVLTKQIQGALKKSFDAQGFNIALNQGELAGQSIPHLHIHVVPRKEGDTGVLKYEPREFLYRPGSREATPEDELRDVADSIRKAIE